MDNFNIWNELKKGIEKDNNTREYFPHVGEVWMCALGKNIGFEQNGGGDNFSRPVLIIKKFNNQMFWAVPLSTKQKKIDFYFNFKDINNKEVSAILAQLKLISLKRLKRKIYDLPSEHLNAIKNTLKKFLE